jgi:hypothetical protein
MAPASGVARSRWHTHCGSFSDKVWGGDDQHAVMGARVGPREGLGRFGRRRELGRFGRRPWERVHDAWRAGPPVEVAPRDEREFDACRAHAWTTTVDRSMTATRRRREDARA